MMVRRPDFKVLKKHARKHRIGMLAGMNGYRLEPFGLACQ